MSDNRSNISPLPSNQKIVNPDGTPTLFMTRWAQERSLDISAGLTKDQVIDLINTYALQAGIGIDITPDGKLTSNPTIELAAHLGDLLDVDLHTTPPTNGQVIEFDAATNLWKPVTPSGGGGGGAISLIGTTTLGANAASMTVSGIPGGYTDLIVVGKITDANANDTDIRIQFNGDTSNHYIWTKWSRFEGVQNTNDTSGLFGALISDNQPGWPSFEQIIYNYASTTLQKYWRGTGPLFGGGNMGTRNLEGRWNRAATAINSLTVFASTGTSLLAAGSTITLYGRSS